MAEKYNWVYVKVHRTLARSNNNDFNFTLSKVENVDSANEDNRVNDSYGSDSEVEERGGVIEQDDSFGVSDSEGGDSIVDKRNFHGGSHVPLIIASLECLELLLELTKRSTIAHDRGKVYFLTNSKIVDIYIEEFRINPNISTTQLQQKLQRRNINQFDDEQAQSFARLFDYVEELKSINSGSTVECEVLKDGWKCACRKIIHIDGCVLGMCTPTGKKKYGGAVFKDLFWGAADAYYIARFERQMEELKKISVATYDDLKISQSCLWSRAFFTKYSSSDALENNLGEPFNAAIRIARTKPVVEMLEDIRRKDYKTSEQSQKRAEADKCRANYIYKSVAKLEEHIELAKNCSPLSCGLGDYEVGYFNDKFLVKMRVNGMNMWKVITNVWINPPLFKKPPVRPPARHNKMYCKKHPFSKSPKNRPGRPHKEVIPHVSAGLFIHAPEGTLGRKWFASASQPKHNVPSLSSGLPKRGPGRPRKKLSEGVYIISFCSII
uniref:Uncharacterized protein n=2 Tax=Brassica oleracea TaxID=3712 RepID=A0A0D3CGK0_BRAOL